MGPGLRRGGEREGFREEEWRVRTLAAFLYFGSIGVWLGSLLFFSFTAAPAIFRVLGTEGGGRVVGAIFPTYYLHSALTAVIALAVLFVAPRWPAVGQSPASSPGTAAVALAAALLVVLVAWWVVEPRVHAAAGTPAFGALHGLSMGLNLLVLVALVVALWFSV
ncbi:MAG: DUF4149 domain-containing protein [Bacillota bacterium]|nr:DUF4149 domain-containing protein [Bacillota bacterium]